MVRGSLYEARLWRSCLRVLAGCVFLLALATPAAASLAESGIHAPQRYRLANGLDVVLQENHRQPLVAVIVSYDLGSRDDPAGLDDLAHLVEHLTYRGSRHLGPYEGHELLQRAGAIELNGRTFPDSTSYEMLLPNTALAQALWVESERMAFTLERFDATSFELERAVVRGERDGRNTAEHLLDQLARNAYFGEQHVYARATAPRRVLRGASLRHAQWLFQQGYRPSNARLVIVGDFEPRAAAALIERYFGPVSNPRVAFARAPSSGARGSVSRLELRLRTSVERLVALWPAPVPGSPERAAAELALNPVRAAIRRQLVAGRLSAGAELGFQDAELGSVLRLRVELASGHAHAEVEASVGRAMADAARIDWEEVLPRLRERAWLAELHTLESPLATARAHLRSLRYRGRPFELGQRSRELQAVTAAQLRAVPSLFESHRVVVGHLVRARPNEVVPEGGRVLVSPR